MPKRPPLTDDEAHAIGEAYAGSYRDARDEVERANRDMMNGIIGGEEWRKRMRDIARDEMTGPRLRWVNCEACGGTGEVIKGPPGEPYNEHAELCPACEGTGRDCE